ncbi:MAG: hypothetical protein K8S87_01775 [Planctomycetes bacterium]|nr:hypothetical protein [Planctomycetota bacterium]
MLMKICPSCMAEVREYEELCPQCGWQFTTISTKPLKTALSEKKNNDETCIDASDVRTNDAVLTENNSESIDNKEMSQQNDETLDSSTKTLNLGLCIDRTGSSEQFQQGIYSCCKQIFEVIEQEFADIRCWMQSHGDLDYSEDIILHTDGDSPQQTLDDIRQITFEGGGDPHETHLDGIENLFRIVPWATNPANTMSAVIVFLTSETKPSKSGISAKELGAEVERMGITLCLICKPTPTLYKLCRSAKGFMFPITSSPSTEDIEQISTNIPKILTQI